MLAIIKKAAKIVGDGKPNYSRLAALIGAQRPALYSWQSIPIPYMNKIVKATKGEITREMLRPDIFD